MISTTGRGDTRLEVQYVIWDMLRERGAMKPRDIRAAVGIVHRDGLRRSLHNLLHKGCVRVAGSTNKRAYEATAIGPFIRQRRKNTPEQEAGLAKGRQMGLRVIYAKRHGKPFIPRPKHHLDRAMGYCV